MQWPLEGVLCINWLALQVLHSSGSVCKLIGAWHARVANFWVRYMEYDRDNNDTTFLSLMISEGKECVLVHPRPLVWCQDGPTVRYHSITKFEPLWKLHFTRHLSAASSLRLLGFLSALSVPRSPPPPPPSPCAATNGCLSAYREGRLVKLIA